MGGVGGGRQPAVAKPPCTNTWYHRVRKYKYRLCIHFNTQPVLTFLDGVVCTANRGAAGMLTLYVR